MIQRPATTEHAPYYARYIERIPECDILEFLETQGRETAASLAEIGDARGGFRYEPDKWSVNQVVGHVSDVERVFAYRALVFSRRDTTPQAGMEQDDWAQTADHDTRSLSNIAAELATVRRATLSLFRGFTDEMWTRAGVASDFPFTTRAVPFIIAGHELHHVDVLRQRYMG